MNSGKAETLIKVINNPDSSVFDLLDSGGNFVYLNNDKIKSATFLQKNAEKILRLCFSDDEEYGPRSFLLFTKKNSDFLEVFLTEDLFYSAVTSLFTTSPNIILISRAASIMKLMVTEFPNRSNEFCGLLFQFLPYCYESGVIDLFESICSFTSELEETQHSFIESHFPDYIMNEIKDTKDNDLIFGLLRIVRHAAENKVLKDSFHKPEYVNIIYPLIEHNSITVLNELWRLIYTLTSPSTLSELNKFVKKSIYNITEPYDTVDSYRVFCIDFLAQMLYYQNEYMKCLDNFQVQQVVLRLIVQFPESTNLMGAVFRFIENSIMFPYLSSEMIINFVPLMVIEATNKTRTATAANCYLVLEKIDTYRKTNKKLNELLTKVDLFEDFANRKLKIYRKLVNNPYGGEIINSIKRLPSSFLLG